MLSRTATRVRRYQDWCDPARLPRQAVADELDGLDVPGEQGLPRIEDAWSLDGLTTQVYGVPKVQIGKGADFRPDRKADPETAAALGASQREFFKLLYNLLIGKDTGPRLPTLLLAVGPQRLRELVTP